MVFRKAKFQQGLLHWFDENKRPLPWRMNRNPYRVWISEVMLQQTQVKTVIPYYQRWFKTFPTIERLAKAPLDKVYKLWEGLGYYSRARNLKKGAEYIQKELKGRFPDAREGLLRIPGVGPYSAGAIASIAFGRTEPLVDGNVGRVFARVFEISGVWNEPRTNKILWEKAREVLSEKYPGDFNEALMELGATVCTKDNPSCSICPVNIFCRAYKNGTVPNYPTSKKTCTEKVEKVTLLLWKNGKVLVRRKRLGRVMGGLWEFPTFELQERNILTKKAKATPSSPRKWGSRLDSSRGIQRIPGTKSWKLFHNFSGRFRGNDNVEEILKQEGVSANNLHFLGRESHGYTHFKAALNIWEGHWVSGQLKDRDYERPRWVSKKDLKKIAFPSIFRRIEKCFV